MHTLSTALPKGVVFDGIIQIKINLFLSDVQTVSEQATAEKMRELFQKLANEVAKVAFDFPEDQILDKLTDKTPLAYTQHRPDAVLSVMNELGSLAYKALGSQAIWALHDKASFEKLVIEVEDYAWATARRAKFVVF